ncbi:MFS family permease [Bradyrhizobium ottawaense]
MSTSVGELAPASRSSSWRTPAVIILCGCAIGMLGFGPRSALGFFVQPMSHEFSWGRDVFGLAIAFQNLLWGLGQPIAGAVADRFGLFRVMCVGALLYAGGLLLMRYSSTPLSLNIGAGVMVGFGLAGCSFNLVLSAFTKLLPAEKRGLALGAGTAAGSFGAVPVRADRRRVDRQFRLAAGALRVRLPDVADHPAVTGALDAAGCNCGQCDAGG